MMNELGMGIVVSMKDMFTQNAARVQSAMTSLDASVAAASERMSRNMDRIQKGTMMIGAGLAMMAAPAALIASTAATQKALAEMASLGTKDLRTLEDAAESFSNTWAGSTKAQFITAAYDVKSALANLSDEAVGTFSAMAALTGKASKATTQEMVETFTTAYGIFKPMMKDVSDVEWAKVFSGALAQTVAAFKTTGPQMAEAIKNVGATASASLIPLEEQMAILGQLQTTMPGSEAGTLYKAFIMKAAEAGDELKLSFIDASGRLKGILPILEELKSKYPDLSQAAAQVQIKKAFGSDEAVKFVLQMSQGMDALKGNISGIAGAMKGGTAVTLEMARAMNMDIGSQLTVVRQQLSNLFEILGRTLLPIVIPLIQGVSRVIVFFQKLSRAVPFLTGTVLTLSMALGAVLVVVGGVVAAAGTIGLMLPAITAGFAAIGTTLAGVGSAVAAWFWPVTLAIGGVILSVYLLKRAWESNFGGIRDMVLGVWDKVSLVFEGIRALTTSLSGGVGQMSADLAQKLEAAGLMGLVTTVFQVYYRVRQFLAGLSEAFAHAFGRIRAILEPAVRSLLSAYGEFYGALFSVFKALGLVATAADGSAFRSLGGAIGTVFGVILQLGAYILRFIITPLTWIVRGLALVVSAVTWTLGIIIQVVISAAKFIYKFCLPVRLLAQTFAQAGRIIYGVWQILTGDGSLLDGLKAIGMAVFNFLGEPFRWVRDVVVGCWNFLTGILSGIGRLFGWVGRTILNGFLNLPIVRLLRAALEGVFKLLSGDASFFSAGKAIIVSLGKGIWAAVAFPFTMLRSMFQRLLGFFTGNTSFGEAGKGIIMNLVRGMFGIIGLPLQLIGSVVRGIIGAVQGAWQGLSSLGQGVLGMLAAPFEAAASLAGAAWDGIKSAASGVLDSIASGVQGVLGRIGGIASGLGSVFSGALSGAWDALVAGEQGALSAAQSVFGGIITSASTMADGIRSVATGIAEAWSEAFSAVRDAAGATWNWVRESAAGAWDSVRGGLAKAGDLAGKAVDGAKNLAGAAWDKAKSFGGGLWESVKSAASGAMSQIETGLGIKSSEPPALPLTAPIPVHPVAPGALQAAAPHRVEPSLPLTRAPRVDTRLIPAVFQALLMLTPVLASAIPAPTPLEAAVRPAVEVRNTATTFLPTGPAQPQTAAIAPITLPAHAAIQPPRVMPEASVALHPVLPHLGPVDVPGMIQMGPLAPVPALGVPGYLAGPLDAPAEPSAPQSFGEQSRTFQPSPLLSRPSRQPFGGEQSGASAPQESLRPLIETLIAKLDALAERPIDLSITTKIDGRQIAQAVYKDLRERKIKNYETL